MAKATCKKVKTVKHGKKGQNCIAKIYEKCQ